MGQACREHRKEGSASNLLYQFVVLDRSDCFCLKHQHFAECRRDSQILVGRTMGTKNVRKGFLYFIIAQTVSRFWQDANSHSILISSWRLLHLEGSRFWQAANSHNDGLYFNFKLAGRLGWSTTELRDLSVSRGVP